MHWVKRRCYGGPGRKFHKITLNTLVNVLLNQGKMSSHFKTQGPEITETTVKFNVIHECSALNN